VSSRRLLKQLRLRQMGLFSQVKGQLKDNLIATYNYWKGSYKAEEAKLMQLNPCHSVFSRKPKSLVRH